MTDSVAQLNAALAGRYNLEREIGAGGMATVFLARDLRHDRRVAVKVLKPELGAVLGVERFLSEIKVTTEPAAPEPAAALRQRGSERNPLLRDAVRRGRKSPRSAR